MASHNFLTEAQEQQIIEAIERAEKKTSGEIRVHLEYHCNTEPLERAATIFHELGMDQTELQNGVLLYVATEDHKAAVYAGKGIFKKVTEGFWSDVMQILILHFKKGEHEEGIEEAINKVGKKLMELFPYLKTDANELANELSYHDNKKSSHSK